MSLRIGSDELKDNKTKIVSIYRLIYLKEKPSSRPVLREKENLIFDPVNKTQNLAKKNSNLIRQNSNIFNPKIEINDSNTTIKNTEVEQKPSPSVEIKDPSANIVIKEPSPSVVIKDPSPSIEIKEPIPSTSVEIKEPNTIKLENNRANEILDKFFRDFDINQIKSKKKELYNMIKTKFKVIPKFKPNPEDNKKYFRDVILPKNKEKFYELLESEEDILGIIEDYNESLQEKKKSENKSRDRTILCGFMIMIN